MGRVAAGASADFLVLAGNPLDDIRRTRAIDSVYFDGRPIDRTAMRPRLTAR
jgi:imidazolonepropionase-like amidohydrolase